MDQVILVEKMESLRRCIQRIEDKMPGNINLLIQDQDLQDILVINLTRAVQLCVDIGSHIISAANKPSPQTMGEVFTTLHELGAISLDTHEQLKKAIGFRNIAVHNYEASIGKLCTRFATILCRIFAALRRKLAGMLLCSK